jgi:hypothetical protein
VLCVVCCTTCCVLLKQRVERGFVWGGNVWVSIPCCRELRKCVDWRKGLHVFMSSSQDHRHNVLEGFVRYSNDVKSLLNLSTQTITKFPRYRRKARWNVKTTRMIHMPTTYRKRRGFRTAFDRRFGERQRDNETTKPQARTIRATQPVSLPLLSKSINQSLCLAPISHYNQEQQQQASI